MVLEEAIAAYHDGLIGDTTLSNKPKLLSGMCESANGEDLDNAIKFGEVAVKESTNSRPYRAIFLDSYARALFQVFKNRGDMDNLELALFHGEDAMVMSEGSIRWPQYASNFAVDLVASSRTVHDFSYLEKGISLL
jgi:hypothetical protein